MSTKNAVKYREMHKKLRDCRKEDFEHGFKHRIHVPRAETDPPDNGLYVSWAIDQTDQSEQLVTSKEGSPSSDNAQPVPASWSREFVVEPEDSLSHLSSYSLSDVYCPPYPTVPSMTYFGTTEPYSPRTVPPHIGNGAFHVQGGREEFGRSVPPVYVPPAYHLTSGDVFTPTPQEENWNQAVNDYSPQYDFSYSHGIVQDTGIRHHSVHEPFPSYDIPSSSLSFSVDVPEASVFYDPRVSHHSSNFSQNGNTQFGGQNSAINPSASIRPEPQLDYRHVRPDWVDTRDWYQDDSLPVTSQSSAQFDYHIAPTIAVQSNVVHSEVLDYDYQQSYHTISTLPNVHSQNQTHHPQGTTWTYPPASMQTFVGGQMIEEEPRYFVNQHGSYW